MYRSKRLIVYLHGVETNVVCRPFTDMLALKDDQMPEAPRMADSSVWTIVKTIHDEACQSRLLIEAREGPKIFRYSLEQYYVPVNEDDGFWPDGLWQCSFESGLFSNAQDAEREAQILWAAHRTRD